MRRLAVLAVVFLVTTAGLPAAAAAHGGRHGGPAHGGGGHGGPTYGGGGHGGPTYGGGRHKPAHGSGRHDGFRQVGYFIQWGIYGRAFYVRTSTPPARRSRLTHINYAFGNVSAGRPLLVATRPGGRRLGRLPAAGRRPSESVDGVADPWGEPLNGNFGQLRS